MNISERLTRFITETGMTAVLRDDTKDATASVSLNGWTFRDGQASGSAVFGPYPQPVTATGVRVELDHATDDVTFASPLALPAGQTYRYTLTVGVS